MSRSSTATNTNTPTAGLVPFSPAWTMDGGPSPQGGACPVPGGPAPPAGPPLLCHLHYPRAASSCDRSSLSSHSSSSGGGASEYCVPRFAAAAAAAQPDCWYDRPRTVSTSGLPPPNVPPKSPKPQQGPACGGKPAVPPCPCCPPSRPPKPAQMTGPRPPTATAPAASDTDSPSKKKAKKPPMPLPLAAPHAPQPVCLCHHYPGVVFQQPLHRGEAPLAAAAHNIGPYDNYDIPKSLLGGTAATHPKDPSRDDIKPDEHRISVASQPPDEYYDTPKNIKDCLSTSTMNDTQYGNYDTPPVVKTLRKPCGCIIKYTTKKSVVVTSQVETTKFISAEHEDSSARASCPCQRVMCWAENWMMLPYCRRGNGMENTSVPIHKVKLSGEGKMPVVNASGEIAIYATVDKSKKTNRRTPDQQRDGGCGCSAELRAAADHAQTCPRPVSDSSNYVNVEPSAESTAESGGAAAASTSPGGTATDTAVATNYENIDFAQSLEYYENARDVLQRAGISQQEAEAMAAELDSMHGEEGLLYTINNGVKLCNKCGHTCHLSQQPQNMTQLPSAVAQQQKSALPESEAQSPTVPAATLTESTDTTAGRQDDYLMMEPSKQHLQTGQADGSSKNFPGYLPMSPITNPNATCNKLKVDHAASGLPSEKAASIPSLAGPAVDRSRKRSESEFPRVPGSAMMMMHHSSNSPYLRRLLMDAADDTRRVQMLTRKRSSSADSSRYLDGCDDFESSTPERPISSSQTKLTNPEPSRKVSAPAAVPFEVEVEQPPVIQQPTVLPPPQRPAPSAPPSPSVTTPPVTPTSTPAAEMTPPTPVAVAPIALAPVATEEETDSGSTSSGSLRTLVRESTAIDQPSHDPTPHNEGMSPSSVHIRRSSSVPCKSGNNRDSSSSNDSGVSTGSLRQRGGDFAEFELPLTTAMSARRHHHATAAAAAAAAAAAGTSTSRHPGVLCLHSSLPRRSKSVDPLRELTFQFQKVKIPAKSSSAEAEVPICPGKRDTTKGFQSPGGEGAIVVPYMDSRSTSSGTSDMSDYIETLSLSSHSSSDTPDSLRLGRPATTTLRPRSGKEYQLIDRSILEGDLKTHSLGPVPGEKLGHQLRGLVAPYANITPVPEKSESPSPGYMSGSPGQDREDQPLLPHPYPK